MKNFAVIISCDKGYTWNPSTCECQCDMWCKPGQYLDHKNCVRKNQLIGRVIEECTTSIINGTMMNNNYDNDNYYYYYYYYYYCYYYYCCYYYYYYYYYYYVIAYVFIGLFLLTLIICFCVFAYFKWLKGKKLFKNKYADY